MAVYFKSAIVKPAFPKYVLNGFIQFKPLANFFNSFFSKFEVIIIEMPFNPKINFLQFLLIKGRTAIFLPIAVKYVIRHFALAMSYS
jgi:hypothetical protein